MLHAQNIQGGFLTGFLSVGLHDQSAVIKSAASPLDRIYKLCEKVVGDRRNHYCDIAGTGAPHLPRRLQRTVT